MKTRTVVWATVSLLSFGPLMSGCNSAASDWAKASSENTVAAYQNFIAAHPKDPHASDAQAFVLQLQDDQGWQEAQHTGTVAAYQTYLQQFPQGSHAIAANESITSLHRAAAWKNTQGTVSAIGIEAFLQEYPTGAEAEQARAKLKNLTRYRMRLASEPTEARHSEDSRSLN